jgi:hypothetical protein
VQWRSVGVISTSSGGIWAVGYGSARLGLFLRVFVRSFRVLSLGLNVELLSYQKKKKILSCFL